MTVSDPEPQVPPTSRRQTRAQASVRRHGSGGRPKKKTSWFREIVTIVVSALVLAFLIKTFLVQSFSIPSQSMEDTLDVGDRILVSRLAPGPLDMHRGDVVVFTDQYNWLGVQRGPSTPSQVAAKVLAFIGVIPDNQTGHLVKRVIGMPGDTVECDGEGEVKVNGVAIDETYLKPGSDPSRIPFSVVVPQGDVWVMGDNRNDSGDSRLHQDDGNNGFVPIKNIVGVAVARTWPLDRIAILHNPSEVFAAVPDPS